MMPTARLLSLLALPLAAAGVLHAQNPKSMAEMHALHTNPDAYIKALEDPARDAYQKPHEVMTALAVKEGEIIADIGAGSGYFSLRLARHVGTAGHVYAVDISPDMTRHLNERIAGAKLLNISTILAKPDDPLLPQPVDRVLIVDVWHHIENQPAYLALLKKQLNAGGEVVMIDFKKEEIPVGPPITMKIAREDLIAQMVANGFSLAREHTFLPYQYFLVFTPK
ncbi:MAG: class I SAM-dependent methyltransferase [Acidobacteria bacterium]|nr:class I SAM-dependent methyltransferase [Acidobacteriota bacterium]